MLGKILKRAFWGWWDNLSFSIINSFLGSLNPFFLVTAAGLMWALTDDISVFTRNPDIFAYVFGISVFCISCFPTTVAAYSIQEKMLDGEMRSILREFWAEFFKVFLRSSLVTLINAAAAFLLTFSVMFYLRRLSGIYPFNLALVLISLFFYLTLLMSQMVLVPLLYREKYRIHEYYMVAFYLTAKNGVVFMGVALVTLLSFLFFGISLASKFTAIVTTVTYIGFSSTLHAWAYRYASGEVSPGDEPRKRKFKELFSPFFFLFPKAKKPGVGGNGNGGKDGSETRQVRKR